MQGVLTRFLLPHVKEMEPAQQMKLLVYIKDRWASLRNEEG